MRPRVRDAEHTTARPTPKEINVGELVVAAIVVVVTAILIWFGT